MNTLCNCLIFAICLLCLAGQALALVASPTKPGPDIRWCNPIDGLSIGIEVRAGGPHGLLRQRPLRAPALQNE